MKKPFLFILFSLLSFATAIAQGGPPNPPTDDGNVDDVVPIDDHIWIIVILAIAFGFYVLRTKRL